MYSASYYIYPADDSKVPYQRQVCFCYTCVHIYVLVDIDVITYLCINRIQSLFAKETQGRYFIPTGKVSLEDSIYIVDRHNEIRANVTDAANMMKMVRDWKQQRYPLHKIR